MHLGERNRKLVRRANNKVQLNKLSYKQIIEYIYGEVINDYDKLKDTPGVKEGDCSGKSGFTKVRLNNGDIISVQGKNSNSIMNEIKNKCDKYNISIEMEIRLKNRSLIIISY